LLLGLLGLSFGLLAKLPVFFFGLEAGLLRLSFYGLAFEVGRDRGDVGGVDIDEVVRIYEGFLNFWEGGGAAVGALELTSVLKSRHVRKSC